jgi:hypothetical protein
VATVESFIVKTGAALAEQGLEPTALRCARDRILTRGANAAAGALTPLETGIAADVILINAAHADPAVRALKLSSTRGGDDRRRSVAEAEGNAGLAAAGADGAGDIGAPIAPLVDLNDFSPVAGKSRALSEGLWGRAFLTTYARSTDAERVRLIEGLSKGAGLALLAVPMIEAFTLTQAQFRRVIVKQLGLAGDVSVPHTHHCGNGVKRVLTEATVHHLEVCPQLGRAIATHNSIRDALAHMVKQCGLTDAAVVETPVTAADGDTTIADVVYFDSLSGERTILEVSVVTVGSDTSLARISRAGLDSVTALLRAREQEKRSHRVIQKITNEAGNNTIFTPIVLSASGAMGPSTVAFLKDVYARAKAAGKFNMKQPDMKYTWNTMVASSYWDMRLSVACTATDAEFQNRIIIRDHTMNLPVVARQPHPDPNHAPHTAPRPPVAGAPNRRA